MQTDVVIVTGSSGLIGSAVCERLAADGYRVVGLDRPGAPNPPPAAVTVEADLTSDEAVGRALSRIRRAFGPRVASVVHLAAYYDFSGDPSPLYAQLTVEGTRRLLGGLRRDFDHVGQFVFSSTMLVHAPCAPGQRINEDWPLEPKWDYPASKVATEDLIKRERGAIPAVILRIAGVYTDCGNSIPLGHQIKRIHEAQLTSRVFPGSTSHGQAFVHLDDVIEALRLCVERRAQLPPELTLLIGEDQTLTYDELQHTFARLIHDEHWETRRVPKLVAKVGAWVQDKLPGQESFIKPWMIDLADDHYALDISRARQVLGWEPKRSLRETLPKMVAALKANPAKWYRENDLEPPPHLTEAGAKPPAG